MEILRSSECSGVKVADCITGTDGLPEIYQKPSPTFLQSIMFTGQLQNSAYHGDELDQTPDWKQSSSVGQIGS
jgi:hypothetical protein